MFEVRKADDRGREDHGWLHSEHTFSFADYYDPRFMGFRALRVVNEDRVEPGRGFGAHGHREMEIISYVLEGALRHDDSTGTGSVISPGDVQRMSAGTGVRHSERNASQTEGVHFYQIWIMPSERGVQPSYEQKRFPSADKRGKLRLVASPDGHDGSVSMHADARLYAGLFDRGETATLSLDAGRQAWVQVARGKVRVNGQELERGDGMALVEEPSVAIEGVDDAELLVFDLA
ncbi:MAG TPA: pirin family protein [Polyangiaceae bacterium]|nr:pirin family protein [Polyangiaceae bacterium]